MCKEETFLRMNRWQWDNVFFVTLIATMVLSVAHIVVFLYTTLWLGYFIGYPAFQVVAIGAVILFWVWEKTGSLLRISSIASLLTAAQLFFPWSITDFNVLVSLYGIAVITLAVFILYWMSEYANYKLFLPH